MVLPRAGFLSVYPGPEGETISSLRQEAIDDAFFDHRALKWLEKLTSREHVVKLVLETAKMENLTWSEYPHDDEFQLTLRERVAEEIDALLG